MTKSHNVWQARQDKAPPMPKYGNRLNEKDSEVFWACPYHALTITTRGGCDRRLLSVKVKNWAELFLFPAQDAVSPLHSPIFKGPSTRANLIVRSRADAPHLKKAALAIEQAAWSHLGYLSYTRSHYEYYAELLDAYPEFQLCLVDEETDYPVAVASSVPFVCSGPDDLPPEGWDWVVETAARNKAHETKYARRAGRFGPSRASLQGLRARADPLPSPTCREPKDWTELWCPCAHRQRPCIPGSRSPTTWRGPTTTGDLMIPGSVAIVPSVAS